MEDSIAPPEVDNSTASVGVDDLEALVAEPAKEETTESETETETGQVDETGAGDEKEPGEVEQVEFDIGGDKFSFPKDSIPEELQGRFQSYVKGIEASNTKKSQALSESMKSLEARETAVKQLHTLQKTTIETYAKGRQLQNEIAQYQAALTPQLMQTDPDNYRLYSDELSVKRGEFNALHTELQQQDDALAKEQTKEHTRQFDEGKAVLERRIKGFSTKVEDIIDYVCNTYGISKEDTRATWPLKPAAAEMAYKAMLFDKLQAKVKTTAKTQKTTVVPIKPTKGKGSKVMKDPGKLSPEAYSKWKRDRQKAGTWE